MATCARQRQLQVKVTTVPSSTGLGGVGGDLNGAIDNAVTAITMDDTTGIVNGDTILIDTEQIHVTTVASGTSLSVVGRGVNGTTAAAHADEAQVFNVTPGKCGGTATSDRAVNGEIMAVYLNFGANIAASDLNGGVNNSVTALTLDSTASIQAGDTIQIDQEQITVTTVASATSLSVVSRGANGTSAAAHADEAPVYIITPASAVTTVKTSGEATGLPSANILVATSVNTSGIFAPRVKPVDNTNTAITNAHDRFAVADTITVGVTLARWGITNAVVATVVYLDQSK